MRTGAVAARAPMFEEALVLVEVDRRRRAAGDVAAVPSLEAQAWAALVTGVRDYLGKNGFPGAIIGLSGGIDSALVLAIAVDALGADRVRTVMMPSPYTADISWIDARDMAQRLGVRYDEISIAPMFEAFARSLADGVRRPARGRDRGEHPGAHPRHAADGAVEQVSAPSC